MPYDKTTWNPGGPPGISAENLNKIESGIEAAHKLVETDIHTPDQSQTAQASGTLLALQSFFANMLKRILGTTNWHDAPPTTLTAAKSHIDAAAPHSGHETPAGAQAKAEAAAGAVRAELNAHKAEIATENTLGHVMVDGDTITITPNGVIRAEGSRFDPDLSYVRIGQNATTTTETDISIGSNALSNGVSESTGNHFGAIAIGERSEGRNAASIAIGWEALASGNVSIALGRSASATNTSAIALGREASAVGPFSVALGYNASAENANEGILGGAGDLRTSKWKVPGDFTVSGTKNFEIPHPKPEKKATHVIRHGAVESPTPGDTLYRWKIQATKDNDLVTIDLPDYFVWLNTNVQIFVTPQGHFGNGYGELNRETEQLEIHCQYAGEYNVLVIGTRNDDHPSVQEWYIKGVEREIGESWTGETYVFSVDEILEVEEIKEVSA